MEEVKLQEICRIEKGKQIDTSQLRIDSPYKYINGGIKESGYYHEYNTDSEAVLVSEGGASCGYVNYVNEKFWCGCHCYKLTESKTLAKYLYYALKGNQDKIMELRSGAAMPNIKKEVFKNMSLLVDFDKNNQQAIVEALDCIQKAINNKTDELLSLDELVKSRFIEMFENKDFGECLFEDICDCLRNGANIKQSKTASGYPITRIETLSNDKFNLDRMGYADIFDLEKYRKYLLQTDDILISHINSTAYLGRAVRYKGESNTPIIHGMNLLCARIKPMYNATYIEHYLKSVRAKDYIRSITKQAVNQASISTTELKLMPISVPPIELQNEFAEFVKLIDKSKFIVQQQIKDLQELLDSKMDEYFR